MADIKWIKITTDIFDDEKIKIIDKYPARDEILVIWFKLLSLAGKVNESGMLFMSNRIPYTSEMLAAIFNREEKTIEMALTIFLKFGMINVEDNEVISIANWEKHQNIDGMEKIKEQSRLRTLKHREKQKLLAQPEECNANGNATVTVCNAIEEDKEKNKNVRTKYGDYKNVLFTEEQYTKLLEEFPYDYKQRIEKLSEYMASTGKPYKDHLATIRAWARKDTGATGLKHKSIDDAFRGM